MKRYILPVLIIFVVELVNGQASIQQANEYYALGNYSKAIKAYKTLENGVDVNTKIAKAYVALGNYGEGLKYYKHAIALEPNNLKVRYDYAKLLMRTKKFEISKDVLIGLILNDSLNPNFHYELGIVLEKQDDTLSINSFEKAYEIDSSHQKAIFKIAKRHIFKRRFEQAHTLIDKGLQNYSESIELISLKAQAYYFQEYYTHAIVWFNKLIDLGETSEFIHEKLSLSYAQNSDYEDAIFHRKKALNYNPYNANAMFVIGTYYERLGNYEMAEDFISKSLILSDVSLSDDYQRLGTVLNRQKKYDEAIKAFQQSLREDPKNMMSEFYLIRTKDEYYADIDTKIKLYEDYLKKHENSPFGLYAEERLRQLKEEKFKEED